MDDTEVNDVVYLLRYSVCTIPFFISMFGVLSAAVFLLYPIYDKRFVHAFFGVGTLFFMSLIFIIEEGIEAYIGIDYNYGVPGIGALLAAFSGLAVLWMSNFREHGATTRGRISARTVFGIIVCIASIALCFYTPSIGTVLYLSMIPMMICGLLISSTAKKDRIKMEEENVSS